MYTHQSVMLFLKEHKLSAFFIFGKKKQPIDVKIIYTTRVTRARWHYTVVIKLYTKGDVSVGGVE